jgi:hypothetical protein
MKIKYKFKKIATINIYWNLVEISIKECVWMDWIVIILIFLKNFVWIIHMDFVRKGRTVKMVIPNYLINKTWSFSSPIKWSKLSLVINAKKSAISLMIVIRIKSINLIFPFFVLIVREDILMIPVLTINIKIIFKSDKIYIIILLFYFICL